MNRQLSKIEALANAKDEASYSFKTSVKSSFEKTANSSTGKSIAISQTMQMSETTIELIGTPKYRTEKERFSKGTIYTTYITAKFRLTKKRVPKKSEIVQTKKEIPKIVEKPKKVIHKDKIIPKSPTKPKYNFQISLKRDIYFKEFSKYIFLIPDEVFSEKKFGRNDFEKNGKYYKRVKKYLYKIKDGKFSKNIKAGKYKLAFLIFDSSFFLKEKSFKTLKFQEYFKKTYNISNQNFSFW